MKDSLKNKLLSKKIFSFALLTIILGISSGLLLILVTINANRHHNSQILEKEALNIQKTLSESFNQINKINSYIGKQIAENGAKDLEFILKIFRQADSANNKNSQLLSWSSFDWVDNNNLQLVNSKIGIRKNPPDMSARQYCQKSPQKPWTLQVSFPVFGNPSESWVIPAGTGVTDNKGKYLGAVVVGFNLSELSAIISQRLSNQVSFLVVDEDMNLITQSYDNENEQSQIFSKKIEKNIFKEKSGFFKNEITFNNINYSFYRKFDEYPYIVIVGLNKALLKKEFNASVMPIITGFTMITCFFLIILHIFKTKILILLNQERKLRDSLHKANKSKTKLIRATSHDLKNYIFGISGLSKLILQDKKLSEIEQNQDLKMIEEISNQSEELMGFVEDLLDTNQNELGEFTLGKMQACDIVNLCKRMVILNKSFAIENNIKLEFLNSSNKTALNIWADLRRIKQILNNLISNAIKYSKADTKVVIETFRKPQNDEICISVTDGGIGMTSQEIEMALSGDGEKIDKSTLGKEFDSHGIGMPIIKNLVELHNGRMEIDSKKGFGTKIIIYFKSHHLTKNNSHELNSHSQELTNLFKNKSLIVAEDDPIGRKINTHLFRKMGFNVKHVENGQEILEELDKNHFDLIFMDINMPVLNGFETAKIIREGNKFKKFKDFKIPIIAITADKPPLSKLQYYGINAIIDKPFSEKEILDLILKYLKT